MTQNRNRLGGLGDNRSEKIRKKIEPCFNRQKRWIRNGAQEVLLRTSAIRDVIDKLATIFKVHRMQIVGDHCSGIARPRKAWRREESKSAIRYLPNGTSRPRLQLARGVRKHDT
jgi:hypothetical protein